LWQHKKKELLNIKQKKNKPYIIMSKEDHNNLVRRLYKHWWLQKQKTYNLKIEKGAKIYIKIKNK
jgi:hypothetical protein